MAFVTSPQINIILIKLLPKPFSVVSMQFNVLYSPPKHAHVKPHFVSPLQQ